jgi:DNA-binding phage protein
MRPSTDRLSPVLRAIQAEAKRQKVTAYRLAQLTGLRVDTTTRLLAGKGNPTLSTVEQVAKALGLQVRVIS